MSPKKIGGAYKEVTKAWTARECGLTDDEEKIKRKIAQLLSFTASLVTARQDGTALWALMAQRCEQSNGATEIMDAARWETSKEEPDDERQSVEDCADGADDSDSYSEAGCYMINTQEEQRPVPAPSISNNQVCVVCYLVCEINEQHLECITCSRRVHQQCCRPVPVDECRTCQLQRFYGWDAAVQR